MLNYFFCFCIIYSHHLFPIRSSFFACTCSVSNGRLLAILKHCFKLGGCRTPNMSSFLTHTSLKTQNLKKRQKNEQLKCFLCEDLRKINRHSHKVYSFRLRGSGSWNLHSLTAPQAEPKASAATDSLCYLTHAHLTRFMSTTPLTASV